jgi:hypothetical protein
MDTAGVFCAVTSDHYDDLYIDKDDLTLELVPDDDTDSEDGSPPHEGMTELSITELSILPAILQAFDPKQLSYEAVSAELGRYLDGPQPTVVYSTHTPQWSDTGDAQYSDLLQQFISSHELTIFFQSTSSPSTQTCRKIRMRSVGGLTIGDSCDRTCVQFIREYRTRLSMDPSGNSIESIIVTHMIAASALVTCTPATCSKICTPNSILHTEERSQLSITKRGTGFDKSSSETQSMNPWVTRSPAKPSVSTP